MVFDHFLLALNNVKKRGVRSWLTMLGIFIGIAAVVSLISLGNGLQAAVTGQFSNIDPDKLTITSVETGFGPPGSTAVKKLTEHDLDLIGSVAGVEAVIPRLIRVAKVDYNDVSSFKYVANIPEDDEQIKIIYDSLNLGLESGRLLSKSDRKKVVLGNDFITTKEYEQDIRVGRKIIIQDEEFEIIGILKKAGTFTINSVILIPDNDMKKILGIDDEIDLIVVQVKNKEEVPLVRERIEDAMRKDRNLKAGEEDFSVQTPEQGVQTINTILLVINLIIGSIAGISLLVGGIGIANTMYTSVLERTKEIGVMKAVGAKNSDILYLFLIEASLLGLVGGIVGAAIGLSLGFLVSYAIALTFSGLNFSVTISYPLISVAIIFSLFIGTIAGSIPAKQAAKLRPVEALRA